MQRGILVSGGLGALAIIYGSVTGHEKFYKSVLMPPVRLLDPEQAHLFAVKLASWGLVPKDRSAQEKILVRGTFSLLIM